MPSGSSDGELKGALPHSVRSPSCCQEDCFNCQTQSRNFRAVDPTFPRLLAQPKLPIDYSYYPLSSHVAGLPNDATDNDLRDLFAPFGQLEKVELIRDPQGRSRYVPSPRHDPLVALVSSPSSTLMTQTSL